MTLGDPKYHLSQLRYRPDLEFKNMLLNHRVVSSLHSITTTGISAAFRGLWLTAASRDWAGA